MSAFGASKLANILHANELGKRLDGTGVTANSLHPGTIRSGFGKGDETGFWWRFGLAIYGPFMASTEDGAATSVKLAADPDLEGVTGHYWSRSKPDTPKPEAQNAEMADRLWTLSSELVSRTS